MYANTLKAKVLSCLFAVTLIVGLCPGLTTTAYANTSANQTEGTEVSDIGTSDADVSSDETDESAVEDESGQGTVLDDLALDSVETELHSLAEVTDWTEVSGSDFQIGSAGSEAVTIGSAANDGSDCYFEGSGATGILHIQSSTPIAIRNTDLTTATANTIQIDAGVKADVTLSGVNIASATSAPINIANNVMDTALGTKATYADEIINKTMLYLTIADGTTNTLKNTCTSSGANTSVSKGRPGIRCGWGSILVIDDSRTNIKAGGSKFNLDDIVTPEDGVVGTSLSLLDGTAVSAGDPLSVLDSATPGTLITQGGTGSSSIGGSYQEDSGTIVINGGTLDCSVWWTLGGDGDIGAMSGGSGIGGGAGGSGTIITINGGNITVSGGCCGAAIGGTYWGATSRDRLGTPVDDAIAIATAHTATNPYSFYAYAVDGGNLANVGEYPSSINNGSFASTRFHTVAGDITINGGYVRAKGSYHGNAIGQGCAHAAASNTEHIIKITGGTVVTSVYNTSSTNPYMYCIGGLRGYTIITGGSVYITSLNQFQGIGDTAYNTKNINSWSDITALEGGALPDADKVMPVTIDLSGDLSITSTSSIDNEILTPIVDWKLEINDVEYDYGAPSYLHNGKVDLWLPKSAEGKKVSVTLSYEDTDGSIHSLEPLYIESLQAVTSSSNASVNTLKRYVEIDVSELTDEQQAYFSLKKDYDGTPLESLTVSKEHPIVTTFESNTKELNDPDTVTLNYQLYDAKDGNPVAGSELVTGQKELPSTSGIYRFEFISKQYATDPLYAQSYWGHRITGWAEIDPVPAVLTIAEDGVQWGYLDETTGEWTPITDKTEGKAGNRIRLAFTIRSANTEALSCESPTGAFQIKIDGKLVGSPIALTKEAIEGTDSNKTWGSLDTSSKVSVQSATDANTYEDRNATTVVYYLDPEGKDGLLDLLDTPTEGGEHTIDIEYQADKNYILGVDKNPENAKDAETFIVPVSPSASVAAEEGKGIVVEDTPASGSDESGSTDTDNTSGDTNTTSQNATLVKKTITVPYSSFHSQDSTDISDAFKLDVESSSGVAFSYDVSNPTVADFVYDEDTNEVQTDGQSISIKVNSCGTSVFTLEQKANALYNGTRYELTVNVVPDSKISPETQVRVICNNLTHPGLPACSGDELEYIVVGTNLTNGSSWQQVSLSDALSPYVELNASTLEVAKNFTLATDDEGNPDLNSLDEDALSWDALSTDDFTYTQTTTTDDGLGAESISTNVGSIYGGQSSAIRFTATVKDDIATRTTFNGSASVVLANAPNGEGYYGKTETKDLLPGEDADAGEYKTPDTPTDVLGITSDDEPAGALIPKDPVVGTGSGSGTGTDGTGSGSGSGSSDGSGTGGSGSGSGTDGTGGSGSGSDTDGTGSSGSSSGSGGSGQSDISVIKRAENITHPNTGTALIGDEIKYSITLTNTGKDTCYYWPVIKDSLPEGLEPLSGSFVLTRVDGTEKALSDGVYQTSTRTVALYVDDLYENESTTLSFICKVLPNATNIANSAEAFGTTPSERWAGDHTQVDVGGPAFSTTDTTDKTQLAYIKFSANGGHFLSLIERQDTEGIIDATDDSLAGVVGTPGASLTTEQSQTFPTAAQAPVCDGYDFVGWFTEPTGGTEVTSYPLVFNSSAGTTIYYAHWQKQENAAEDLPDTPDPQNGSPEPVDETQCAHIIFSTNGGLGTTVHLYGEPGSYIEDTSLPDTEPSATGYLFDGWYTDPVAGDKVEALPDTYPDTPGTTIYYAHWTVDPNYTDPASDTWPPDPGTPWSPVKGMSGEDYVWDDPDDPFSWDEYLDTTQDVQTETPASVGTLLPADPNREDLEISLSAKNETRSDGYTYVGDIIAYTLVVSNNSDPEEGFLDVVAKAEIPTGLDLIPGSLYLTTPDGKTVSVPDSAYDKTTGVLAVNVGDLLGGQKATVVFKTKVGLEAITNDVGMTGSAFGTLPSEFDGTDDTYVKPEVGSGFVPAEGWSAYEQTHTGVVTPDKVYPSKYVNARVHVLPQTKAQEALANSLANTGDASMVFAITLLAVALLAGMSLYTASRRLRE